MNFIFKAWQGGLCFVESKNMKEGKDDFMSPQKRRVAIYWHGKVMGKGSILNMLYLMLGIILGKFWLTKIKVHTEVKINMEEVSPIKQQS